MNASKISFVVVDEHTFGCVDPRTPLDLGVLCSMQSRGAPIRGRLVGVLPLPLDPSRVRPATKADFAEFRVSPKGYDRCPFYDFPKE